MNLTQIVKASQKVIFDNSPLILTGLGVAGVLGSTVLATRATMQAERILREDAFENHGNTFFWHDSKDRFLMTWHLYIPAATTAGMTVACIILANRIGTRRAAAMAAAYALTEKAFEEYKDKVVEKIGENKERKVREEIQQDAVLRNPPDQQIVIIGSGSQLCFDYYSGRYFMSSMEELKKAQNDIDYQIINDNYASLTDFYNKIGVSPTAASDEVGWNIDRRIELEYTATLTEDQRPAIAINFHVMPIRDYYRLR